MENQTQPRRKKHEEEEHPLHLAHDESNWLVSYADLMTLLFGFFVLMFALSRFDQNKFEVVRKDIAKKFSMIEIEPRSEEEKRKLEELLIQILADFGQAEVIESQMKGDPTKDDLESVNASGGQSTEETNPAPKPLEGSDFDVAVNEDNEIELKLSEKILFTSGSSRLTKNSSEVVRKLGQALKALPLDLVTVEGHTDDTPIRSALFESNWELSATRSATIVRSLLNQGLESTKLKAVGYAETRPLAPHRDEKGQQILENRAINRRVIIRISLNPENAKKVSQVGLSTEREPAAKKNDPATDPAQLTLEDRIKKKEEDLKAAQTRLAKAKENQRKLQEKEKMRRRLEQLDGKIKQIDAQAEDMNKSQVQ